MTTNAELIAEARLAAAGELSMAVLEQPGYHTGNQELFNRLADALEAVSVPVEVTERERLIADALLIAGALEEYEFEDVAADAAAVMNSLVDLLAAGFRAPAADGDSAQSRIDQHMQKIAHRVMDVFENAEEDTLADDIMQDVFEAIGLTESFGVESEEGEK